MELDRYAFVNRFRFLITENGCIMKGPLDDVIVYNGVAVFELIYAMNIFDGDDK